MAALGHLTFQTQRWVISLHLALFHPWVFLLHTCCWWDPPLPSSCPRSSWTTRQMPASHPLTPTELNVSASRARTTTVGVPPSRYEGEKQSRTACRQAFLPAAQIFLEQDVCSQPKNTLTVYRGSFLPSCVPSTRFGRMNYATCAIPKAFC